MFSFRRLYGTKPLSVNKFELFPEYQLKCGLEIHTQLDTKNKLFSLSTNDPFSSANRPNFHTSYFDVSLPGTQPKLNYEAVLFATKLSVALNCEINLNSQFDRKHYFYGDQPLGYQITQHYNPFSSHGILKMYKDFDGIDEEVKGINIIQLQIEQDTGKSVYKESDHETLVDLNRSNVPLIELVTEPDFTDLKQVRAFIKKYQNLVRHLKISTGDLETGAMRVDVNMSINNHARVELKNLPNTSSIANAIKYEYHRQVEIIKNGKAAELLAESETRGWNGSTTVKLRSKETTIDYRYMPDPELPRITLAPDVITGVTNILPKLPDEILKMLVNEPYNLSLKDAKILTVNSNGHDELYDHEQLQWFYLNTFHDSKRLTDGKMDNKLPTNWIIHELLGNLNKLRIPITEAKKVLPPQTFADFLMLIHTNKISKASGKLLLFHALNNFKESQFTDITPVNFPKLIEEYELDSIKKIDDEDLKEVCQEIIDNLNDDKMIQNIVSGKKKNSLKFLVGQGMRASQGRIQAQLFEKTFKEILNIKW